MRGPARLDAVVAAVFVLGAFVEAVVVHRASVALMVFHAGGAPVLGVLVVRRIRPLLTVCVIVGFGALGAAIQAAAWPGASNSGGVWLFAMVLATYSLGSYARGRATFLGAGAPLLVVLIADLPTATGWHLVSGVLFVTAFIGVLPAVVGRLVRVRRDRLARLEEQRGRILSHQRAAAESAVLAERLSAAERLQPALLDGMRSLAQAAEAGSEPGLIETGARDLLARTRQEVMALTAPVPTAVAPDLTRADLGSALREIAQPWATLAGGAIAVGLALESIRTLPLAGPNWVAVLGGLGIGAPLAMVWWRPTAAVTVAWVAAAVFSHLLAPLDGTLSETAFALFASFAVGALSRRRLAAIGLVVCWVGQFLVGVGDLGEPALILVCWFGGVVVGDVNGLVERGHAYNQLLSGQEGAAARRAVVAERIRIARELHDQIGHSLTVVALQAGAARRIAAADPERAQAMRRTIATAAREGLIAIEHAAPATDLAALVELTRAAGQKVEVDITEWWSLDPERRAVAYRLIQEALTNVMRHAPGSSAAVCVRRDDEDIIVTVRNTAPSHPGDGPGTCRGLIGIRERVAAQAGRVGWGPRPDGGFEVRAVLPEALQAATP